MISAVQDFLRASVAARPDHVAVVSDEGRFTYREIDALANGVAAELVRAGVQRGDRVLTLCDNGLYGAASFWGALKANAVVSPLHPHTRVEKLAFVANDCRAKAIVVDADHATIARKVASPHLAAVVSAAATPLEAPPPRVGIELDLAAIIYTSGTTGEPKGVMFTHRNVISAAQSVMTYLDMRSSDVVLGVLPFAYGYGLYQMIMTFAVGGRLVTEKSFVYPPVVLSRVVAEGVTGFPGVPTMFAALLSMKGICDYDFSAVRYVTNAGAALPVPHLLALKAVFPAARIFSMYGMTECKRCTYLPPDDVERKPESVGVPIPNTEIWIVDADGRRVGPGVVGELVVRGPNVMAGYWARPEETARKLRPGPVPGERVLHTGDLGFIDAEGYFTFVGRTDDIIKSRGEKVAPKEIEAVLQSVPGVIEAVVVGVPDPILGQAPIAYVVVGDAPLDGNALRRACQARLEPHLVPKAIEIVPSLPRSNNGKVDRGALGAGGKAS